MRGLNYLHAQEITLIKQFLKKFRVKIEDVKIQFYLIELSEYEMPFQELEHGYHLTEIRYYTKYKLVKLIVEKDYEFYDAHVRMRGIDYVKKVEDNNDWKSY